MVDIQNRNCFVRNNFWNKIKKKYLNNACMACIHWTTKYKYVRRKRFDDPYCELLTLLWLNSIRMPTIEKNR